MAGNVVRARKNATVLVRATLLRQGWPAIVTVDAAQTRALHRFLALLSFVSRCAALGLPFAQGPGLDCLVPSCR